MRPLPGARELLARMKEEGLKLAVASSSKEDTLRKLLALVEGESLLCAVAIYDGPEDLLRNFDTSVLAGAPVESRRRGG